jgi:nucleoside-diphosphate-sugar epimerase
VAWQQGETGVTRSDLSVVFGDGPVGRAIARHLIAAGRPVRVVTRRGTAVDGANAHQADAMDPVQATAACADAARVFQCAAPAYHRWVQEFPALQDNILTGAAQAGAVLVAAENLYGYGVAGTLTENMPLSATTRKGRTRALMTDRLFAAHRAGRVQAVAGRAADFIGAGVRQSLFGDRLWPDLLAGRPLRWPGNPDVRHSATHVADFARALILLGDAPTAWGHAWHVPSPPARSPRAVMQDMASRAGVAPPVIRPLPMGMLRAAGLFQPAAAEMVEMVYSCTAPFVIDDTAFRTAFGMQPTPWDAILDETLGYWRP